MATTKTKDEVAMGVLKAIDSLPSTQSDLSSTQFLASSRKGSSLSADDEAALLVAALNALKSRDVCSVLLYTTTRHHPHAKLTDD